MESFRNLEDETFPSFLSNASLGSSGRVTLGNVTLASNLGVPMAASTVAKSRAAAADNRLTDVQASYLDEGPISLLSSQASNCGREKFALSFKDDLENTGEFNPAHRFSDLLVKVNLDESDFTSSKVLSSKVEAISSDISTGLLTFSHIGGKDSTVAKNVLAPVTIAEESFDGEALDHDGISGSVASFLENEKLASIDSMDSDVTDNDFDADELHDDELKLYFNKLIPPGMQRGRVEGQEIPAADLPNNQTASSQPCVTEPTASSSGRRNFLDNYKGEYCMPNVRLAATGMDSCPASDEDTEDELDAMRSQNRTRFLLPSSSRQLVGETHQPHFRPGLEGGSSDEESQSGAQFMDFRTSIEHRHSAEGQVIDSPLTGDGGGGDGSSGSEEDRNVGVPTVPLTTSVQTTYDVLRGLGIVGGSCTDGDQLHGLNTFGSTGHCNMEDRVGPVGTVENDSTSSISAFNHPNDEDREEALNAMDSSHAVDPEERFDSMYLMAGGDKFKDSALPGTVLQGTQNSFHLSFAQSVNNESKDGVYTMDFSALSLRGGPCGNANNLPDSDAGKSGGSMDEKYLSESENKSDIWNRPPDGVPLDLQQDSNNANSVVYQNEDGKWVTDLAYYSSFTKDVEIPEDVAMQLQNEEFVDGGQAMEKIVEDQKIFEKEHQFIQEEQIEAVNSSTLLGDTSWKSPTGNQVPMRASQVSKEFEKGDQSYLRISLGEFFQQRSEALGCLGSSDDDVKRPSFGYIINSPEKREPFALLRPSEFGSRESSMHYDTVEITDADETMNPDDLEKTLEPTPAEQPEGRPTHLGNVMENSGNSSGSSTNQTLSISTIASAIADASISSDPAQLAAMIMELSKKNRSRYRQAEESVQKPGHPAPSAQTYLRDTMHITSSLADLSALEMEKYLKKAEVSSSDSDASSSQSCLDVLSLTSSLAHSQHSQTLHKTELLSPESKSEVLTPKQLQPTSVSEVKKLDVKKSAIPRPKTSNILPAGSQPARRSLGAGQSLVSPSSVKSKRQSQSVQVRSKSDCHLVTPSENKNGPECGVRRGTARPLVSETSKPLKSHDLSDHPSTLKTSPGFRGGRSELPAMRSPNAQQKKSGIEQTKSSSTEDSRSLKSSRVSQAVPKETQAPQQCTVPAAPGKFASPEHNTSVAVEASHCSFRPSTSPLTQSSPSQTSLPSGYGELSPASSGGVGERSPVNDSLSPQSHCSSPSLSRLTYLSINEHTVMPTPDNRQKNNTMSLSTTIIRASPTPPMESFESNEPVQQNNSGTVSSSSHLQTSDSTQKISDVASRISNNGKMDYRHDCGPGHSQTEPQQSLYTRIDSGYSSNLNIQHHPGGVTLDTNQVRNVSGAGSDFLGSKYGVSPITYKSEHLPYGVTPNYDSHGTLADVHTSVQGFVPGRPLVSAQLPQQYMCTEGPVQTSAFHMPPLAGPYSLSTVMSGATPQIGHAHLSGPTGLPSGFVATGQHQYPINKPYGQPSMGSWSTRDLADLRTQVVVPDELKFPGACCVGIACQTSLSIFNPSERWQQVAISIVNLSIDGEKVDSMPYQWLIVKHKTIIGPKSTEEQKVLLIAPRAGLYQCTLSVSSWPASAESETVAQAEVFAKKVVLSAVAENPSIEVDVGKTGCLDFGDLAGGSMKALPLKVVNRTRATVPIRLVISATASAWNCFSFSKSPVALTTDNMLTSGANLPSISVINHVLHSGYGDNADSFVVWVHYNAPQRYKDSSSGKLGPPDEFSARVDIEVDSPGPSRVIQSVGVRARSGTARVHAPKDLQTVFLRSALGQSSSQTLPLKNAGNIDVQLQLKSTRDDDCFTVKPEELLLRTGEEQSVVITFTAQGSQMYRESLLTILVLPSGPQYEVVLKGEMVQENSGRRSSASVVVPHGDVPPILSNKQFMAWGGVTLGRAVQQKLVLRNNSPNTSQQLRLLIRGQDQDCFQLQSSFGPDERLTRSRELLIKPKEDVAIHLLFAPTRVACMLAKLEIKQSAVRPSQPGVKFTIPLSGYGGTSNVILEELRKRADGYVATLSGIQTGRVSKLCVCVRNTGSRAAFVRAVPYSDLEKRTVMDSTVISLSPSQFILKERTQEVITVVMKASCREQALCQSHTALLATVCLFCGDEVSRQQYRKFLENKPDAGKKVLSENSLLKSISFDEPFLGEELVEEAFDLPQRPNEAQIFFANMSKVILSLFGTVDTSDSGESDNIEFVRPSQHHVTDSDSGLGTSERHFSNISLDVLPVKGPPLCVSEPIVKTTESSVNSWCIQPEQLVLTAPSVSCAADTKHVRLLNRSDRELSFDLSWPAHCLTITPQHGVIDPQSHLQILISPNPSLATKSSLLPWSGQIYVQCDNQQKFIKVQIRQDLAMDISATGPSSERSLCPLPPQTETPVGPGSKVQSCTSMSQVEIKNRTLLFPSTCSGESSDCLLDVENHGEEVRWYLSSFAPPYVKDVDGSGDVYRATYTAFRCEKMSGMLGVKDKMQVAFTFLPRDGGDYAQFWDLECHPVSKPQQKSRIRFQLCGTGIRIGKGVSQKEDCTLVRTEANVKNRKRVESVGSKSSMESTRRGLYAPQSLYTFPQTRIGDVSTLKVNFRNNSANTHELRFISPTEPFYIKHSKYSLRTQHYINLPVQFKPTVVGQFSGSLLAQTDTGVKVPIDLCGEALP